MLYHSHSIEQALDSLKTSIDGLSSQEAYGRQKRAHKRHHRRYLAERWRVVSNTYVCLLFVILVLVCAITFYLGQLVLSVILLCTIGIYSTLIGLQYYLIRRKRSTIDSHSQQTVKVLRDGREAYVAAKDIVTGDVVFVNEGDSVYHTGRLISANDLCVDEFTVTGEERFSKKHTRSENSHTPREMRHNMLYEGSHIAQGSGAYVITAIRTPAKRHQDMPDSARMTSLYDKKATFVTLCVFLISLVLAVVTFDYFTWQGGGIDTEYLLLMIAIAVVSALNIIVIVRGSVLLHLGLLAKQNLQVPSLLSLEKLHALKNLVISTKDITTPRLYVHSAITPSGSKLSYDTVAQVIVKNDVFYATHIDTGLATFIKQHATHKPAANLFFDHKYQMSGNIWHYATGYRLYLKGSPEAIISRAILSEKNRENAEHTVLALAAQGHHVLAIAKASLHEPITDFSELSPKTKFDLLGFISFERELLDNTAHTVAQIKSLHATVRLHTNEHPEAAYQLAKAAGIATSVQQVWSAHHLRKIPQHILAAIDKLRVFSRPHADQLEQIISALKYQGLVGATLASNHHRKKQAATVTITSYTEPQNIKDASELLLPDTKLPTIYQALLYINTVISSLRVALYVSVVIASLLIAGTYLLLFSIQNIPFVYTYGATLFLHALTPLILLLVIRRTIKKHTIAG